LCNSSLKNFYAIERGAWKEKLVKREEKGARGRVIAQKSGRIRGEI